MPEQGGSHDGDALGAATRTAADLHHAVQEAVNACDIDALVALYEPDALLVGPDGSVARGHEAIRATWTTLCALGGTMALSTRHCVVTSDIALLRNDWTYETADGVVSSSTAEVARRDSDGRWRYLIDHPFGAAP